MSESKLIEAGNTALAAMESARPKPGLEVVAAFLRMVFSLTIPRRAVRRQGFWDQWRPKLRESLAHLVGLIMRRAGGDASVALRVSFV